MRFIAALLCLIVASSAYSSSSRITPSQKKDKKMVTVLKILDASEFDKTLTEMIDVFVMQISRSGNKVDPSTLAMKMKTILNIGKLYELQAPFYYENFSQNELDDILIYMTSAGGKKHRQMTPQIMQATVQFVQQQIQQNSHILQAH